MNMKLQRINTETRKLIRRPHSRHDGLPPVIDLPDGEPLPTTAANEAYALILDEPDTDPAAGKQWESSVLAPDEHAESFAGWIIGWIEVDMPSPVLRPITKLQFMRGMEEIGKWGAFKQLYQNLPERTKDLIEMTSAFDPNDADFQALAPALKTQLGLTDEQYDGLFIG